MHMQRTQRNNRTTNCCPGKEVLIATWYALARSLRMSQGRTLLTVHTEFHLSAHLHRSRRRVRVGRLRRRRHLPRGACDRYHPHGGVPHPPLCKARGEAEGARPGAACLLLVARLVRGLEAIGPKQHEAVDVPAARGGATRLNHRGGGRAGGWPRGRVRGGGGVYGRGLRMECGARRMDGSDQPYTAALSAPCSGMHTASPTARR